MSDLLENELHRLQKAFPANKSFALKGRLGTDAKPPLACGKICAKPWEKICAKP